MLCEQRLQPSGQRLNVLRIKRIPKFIRACYRAKCLLLIGLNALEDIVRDREVCIDLKEKLFVGVVPAPVSG